MVLEFIRDNLNGDSWELWCDGCYRDRYQSENFTKVPAGYMGDGGIEGYTSTGIVYQCYCPEKIYTDDELYVSQRDKLTKDIGKLLQNGEKLKKLGIHLVKEWHFVTPEYRDKRLVEHKETKTQEVLKAKREKPDQYTYIDDDFQIILKVAEDFKVEFIRLIRNPLVDLQLNFAVKSVKEIDWTECETEKLNNIKRKVKAIMDVDDEENEDYKEMISFWATAYLKGIEIMNNLLHSYGEIYEELFELEQQYKLDVGYKSRMNPENQLNSQLFNSILDDFGNTIEKQFACFSAPSIMELKRDLVSGWLADCSLQFRAR